MRANPYARKTQRSFAIRAAVLAAMLMVGPAAALADPAGPLGSSSPGSLWQPSYNTLGQTSSTHLTTIRPRGSLEPSGPIGTGSRELAPPAAGPDSDTLLERHLDCYSTALTPGRDSRNSFLSRCPGNGR